MSRSSTPKPSAPNKVFVRKDPDAWKRKGWTSAPNSIIHDYDLHPMEAWAWIWFASHTATFELNAQALSDANRHVGRDKAYKLVQALEGHGLLLRGYERSEAGVPYMVYDLQPVPVPPEERTSKTRPRKAAPKERPHPAKQARRAGTDSHSWRASNAGTSSENDLRPDSALLMGQESGRKQHFPGGPGEDPVPGGSVPGGSGESYKEHKTNQKDQPTKRLANDSSGEAHRDPATSGWLGGQKAKKEPAAPETAGSRFLSQLVFADGTGFGFSAVLELSPHVNSLLESGWTEARLTSAITDTAGIDQVKSWPAFVRRKLEGLKPIPARTATRPAKPRKCSAADCDESRMRRAPDGRPYPCSNCHPRALREQREQAQQQPETRVERGETVGGIGELDDLLAG